MTIMRMGIDNVAFMLDRLGKDCSPQQYLRELTQNAVEAIQRTPEGKGTIVWDVDPYLRDDLGVEKLSIIDTGVGMTGEEMRQYINKVFSSSQQQGYSANYGIGAKIAALTRSPAGLIYQSWKDGKGTMAQLLKDPATGEYGMAQIELPDGSYENWAPLDDMVKPPEIKKNGTKVILLGETERSDTFGPPPSFSGTKAYWVAWYLGNRYFRFPKGITVKAREWDYRDGQRYIRTVPGQEETLTRASQTKGTVQLSDAKAHWWIIPEAKHGSRGAGNISGHTAALFQDELYEMVPLSRGGAARLQTFGVVVGYAQVVIYVEPKAGMVIPNTARTHLLVDETEEPLPWSRWASEFREQMPEEIDRLIELKLSKALPDKSKEDIKKRLMALRDLYKPSKYRPTPNGDILTGGPTDAGKPDVKNQLQPGPGNGGGNGGSIGNVYTYFIRDDGKPSRKVRQRDTDNRYPTFRWIDVLTGTRVPPDLEDRAARYLPDQNHLLINRDFRCFKDTVGFIHKKHPQIREYTIQEFVEAEFSACLCETVVSVQGLQGSREWTKDTVQDALSETALTATVLPRFNIVRAVEDRIKTYMRDAAKTA
jgi:hypothetical protein